MKLLSLARGYRTYAVVAAGLFIGVVQGLDAAHVTNIAIPGFVNWLVVFLGLGTTRMAVAAQSATAARDLAILAETVLAKLTVPPAAVPNAQSFPEQKGDHP